MYQCGQIHLIRRLYTETHPYFSSISAKEFDDEVYENELAILRKLKNKSEGLQTNDIDGQAGRSS